MNNSYIYETGFGGSLTIEYESFTLAEQYISRYKEHNYN
jgi:hypothetical protein